MKPPLHLAMPLLALLLTGCGTRLWGFGPIEEAYLIAGGLQDGGYAALGFVSSSKESCSSELYQDNTDDALLGDRCKGLELLFQNIGETDGFIMESPVRDTLTFHTKPTVQMGDVWGSTAAQIWYTPCYGDEYPSSFHSEEISATVTLPSADPTGSREVTLEFEGEYEGGLDFYLCP